MQNTAKISDLISVYEPQSPFATHIPLLKALGHEIETVLELGAGIYSTSLFLNRLWYPQLRQLVSVEQKAEWIVEADDPRHQVLLTPEPIESLLDTLDLDQFDLIFVDNSDSGERRCDTLRYVASRCGQSIVVAHDYDIPSYCEAATGFSHGIIDDRQKPYTALLWR
jgi:predicted O-methyltransferase YrrM